MHTSPEGLTGIRRLRAALEGTAAALAAADLDRLLAADAALQAALNAVPLRQPVEADVLDEFRRELDVAASALLRCRRLGAGLTDFVRISLEARGEQLGYDPSRDAAAALTGRALSQRV